MLMAPRGQPRLHHASAKQRGCGASPDLPGLKEARFVDDDDGESWGEVSVGVID